MDKYELLNQIGDGTFGSVAKAVSKKTGQLVAIKKMKQKYYTWEECVKLPEVDVVRRIHGHPNVVKLREVIRENNELFFVFEYMDGDLLGVIKKAKQTQRPEDAGKGPAISYPAVKNYMRQLLQSLAYLHKRGYFHRDLKPENLLVKRDGQEEVVKLADFGLVKEIRARPPYTDYVSTRWYRSPELLLQDRAYSSPVDIWAAGCIMSELITTRPLFPGSNEVDQLFKIMNVLGSPTEKCWPGGITLARKIRYTFPTIKGSDLDKVLPSHVPAQAIDLMNQMLTYDPKSRPTAEQCLQHPYFSVGIDDSSAPSAAAIDQLSNAARRLQPNPQSAPAALLGVPALEQQQPKDLKGKRASLVGSGLSNNNGHNNNFSAQSPQKFYMLGAAPRSNGDMGVSPKAVFPNASIVSQKSPALNLSDERTNVPKLSTISNLDAGAKDRKLPHESPKATGLKGLHLANVRAAPAYKTGGVSKMSFSPTVPLTSKPKPADVPAPGMPPMPQNMKQALKKQDTDLDNLMDEFAAEITSLGLNAEKQDNVQSKPTMNGSGKTVSHTIGGSSNNNNSDPVAALLSNSRYKKNSISLEKPIGVTPTASHASGNTTATSSVASKLAQYQAQRKIAKTSPTSVSPSIKTLMTKHRNSGTFAFQ